MMDFGEFITQLVRKRNDLCILSLGTRKREDGQVITEAHLLKSGEPFPYSITIKNHYFPPTRDISVSYRFSADSLDLQHTIEFESWERYNSNFEVSKLHDDFEKAEADFHKFLALFTSLFGKEVKA